MLNECMPNVPKSYDEITRATVPEMDSSFAPTAEQKQQAREGFRALDSDEQPLADRVHAALAGNADAAGVQIEVEHKRVTLRGQVPDAAALARVVDAVRGIGGGVDVDDQLVVAAK